VGHAAPRRTAAKQATAQLPAPSGSRSSAKRKNVAGRGLPPPPCPGACRETKFITKTFCVKPDSKKTFCAKTNSSRKHIA